MIVTLARKPFTGNVVSTSLAQGVGSLNINSCRVETYDSIPMFRANDTKRWGNNGVPEGVKIQRTGEASGKGRWPANVLVSPSVTDGFPILKGCSFSRALLSDVGQGAIFGSRIGVKQAGDIRSAFGDSGSAARFFKRVSGC